jgi:heme exporter protein D
MASSIFIISNIDNLQSLLYPITTLKSVNGINSFLEFNTTKLPERIRVIHYSAEFLGNYSYIVWLTIAVVFVCLMVYFVGKIWLKYRDILQKVGLRIMKRYFVMIISFNTFNICYSAGLQFSYGE